MNQRTFLEQLDAVDNEAEVRERLAAGNYNARHATLAQEWLRRKESSRSTETAARKEAREEEGLAISRRALANSQLATRIAIVAIVLSVVMAIQRVIEWLSK
jgi:hypothetical protein